MNTGKLTVGLGARAYDIHIGPDILEQTGALLSPLLSRPRTVIITDENVTAAQGDRLKAGLLAADIDFDIIVLPPGEQTKSFAQLQHVTERLLETGVERTDTIIAFGGGVIGDLVGLAAALLRRGCRFAQIPTSLLAQVDSAVGGKTAINSVHGKNLVGAFHQPCIVLADTRALETLPARQMRAGYAEIVKYGLIGDADFFGWLERNGAALLSQGGGPKRAHAVKTSCQAKARLVEQDEREQGVRALLNFGHTFGHALEAVYGYCDTLLHGEAVAAGMALAFDYSVHQGLCPPQDAARVKAHLAASGLPVNISGLPPSEALNADHLIALMMQDKKVEQGRITLILAEAIGKSVIVKDASIDSLKSFLRETTAS